MPISRQDRVNHWRALAADVPDAAAEATDPDVRATLCQDLALRAELADLPAEAAPKVLPVRGAPRNDE
jgi:hypothetical protein